MRMLETIYIVTTKYNCKIQNAGKTSIALQCNSVFTMYKTSKTTIYFDASEINIIITFVYKLETFKNDVTDF